MMKKNILLLFMLSFSLLATAQKGKVTVGGSLQLNPLLAYYDYDYFPYYPMYNTQAEVGYFLSDKLLLGLGFRMAERSNEQEYDNMDPYGSSSSHAYVNTNKTTYMNASPFVRWYSGDFFVSASASYRTSMYEYHNYNPYWVYNESDQKGDFLGFEQTESFNKDRIFSMGLNAGYSLAYNDRIFVEPSIAFMKSFSHSSDHTSATYLDGTVVVEDNDNPGATAFDLGLYVSVHLRLGK